MFGIPRGVLAPVAQTVAGASAGLNVLELNAHGFENNDPVFFGPNECGALPEPLVANTQYYVLRVSDSRFSVALTAGGVALTFATDGVDFAVWTPLSIDEVLELYSRKVDQQLPAHAVPLQGPDYPLEVVEYVAIGAARALASLSGKASEDLDKREAAAVERFNKWALGVPLRDESLAQVTRTNLAVVR